jgi:hypothetical protein
MPAQQAGDEVERLGQFRVGHARDDGGHQGVVGKFLEMADHSALVRFPIQPETDEAGVRLDKMMGVFGHGLHAFCTIAVRGR